MSYLSDKDKFGSNMGPISSGSRQSAKAQFDPMKDLASPAKSSGRKKPGGPIGPIRVSKDTSKIEVPKEMSAVEETPVVEAAPAVEETPVVEAAPAVEVAPAVEETPVLEAVPAADEAPAIEETPVIEEMPVIESNATVEEANIPSIEEPFEMQEEGNEIPGEPEIEKSAFDDAALEEVFSEMAYSREYVQSNPAEERRINYKNVGDASLQEDLELIAMLEEQETSLERAERPRKRRSEDEELPRRNPERRSRRVSLDEPRAGVVKEDGAGRRREEDGRRRPDDAPRRRREEDPRRRREEDPRRRREEEPGRERGEEMRRRREEEPRRRREGNSRRDRDEEMPVLEKPSRERRMRDDAEREMPAKEKRVKERPVKEKPVKEKAVKEKPVKEKAVKEKPVKEKSEKGLAVKEKMAGIGLFRKDKESPEKEAKEAVLPISDHGAESSSDQPQVGLGIVICAAIIAGILLIGITVFAFKEFIEAQSYVNTVTQRELQVKQLQEENAALQEEVRSLQKQLQEEMDSVSMSDWEDDSEDDYDEWDEADDADEGYVDDDYYEEPSDDSGVDIDVSTEVETGAAPAE